MIDQLPFLLPAGVIGIALAMIVLLYRATNRNRIVLIIVSGWLLLQAALAYVGFYANTTALPPRPLLAVIPAFLLVFTVAFHARFKDFRDSIDLGAYTWLHSLRVPIEFCIFYCYLYGWMPEIMTFEGRNFDILAGLSAPIIAYACFVKKTWSRKVALWWNVAALALLFNIVFYAALSIPAPFQQFSFDQPNRAVLYFPFIWIPAFFVPTVLLGHLIAIKRLSKAT